MLDYLHGTDSRYRNTVQYKRHKILMSTSSAAEEYPNTTQIKTQLDSSKIN